MPLGKPFIQLFEVESTNNYAMAKVQAQMAEHGTVWFASHQTAGKGQRGKKWLSAPGENIILSMALNPAPLLVEHQFIISAVVSVACFDFFNNYCTTGVSIKWPNDLYWKDRKAGGILIENVIRGSNWNYSIIGIGININQTQFEEGAANPVSLRQVTDNYYDTIALAQELCTFLDKRWNEVLEGKAGQIIERYVGSMYKLNQVVDFKLDNALFSARIKGVNTLGELLVDADTPVAIPIGRAEWMIG